MSYFSSPQDSQQFELFKSEDQNSGKKGFSSKKISLAIEHLIIIGIVLLILCVVIFSFGFERGKHVAIEKNKDLEINLVNSENDAIIPPSSDVGSVKNQVIPSKKSQVAQAPSTQALQTSASPRDIVVDVPVPVEVADQHSQKSTVSDVTGVYTVQVASFKQEKFATQEVDLLKKRSFEAFVVAKGDFYLVCVGKHKNKNQAEKTSKSLKSKYKDNVIRRL